MTNIPALITANASRWKAMHVHTELSHTIDVVVARLIAAKARYESASSSTISYGPNPAGYKNYVPWYVIAVIHEREASQSWLANLAQGDPWNKVSVHVPRGRGPFPSWEAAAADALVYCPPRAASWRDWSIGGILTLLEEYNGLGYASMGRPSPYVWASTDQYHSGKYIADGHYDPNAVDHQLGCASLLSRMTALDTSINLGGLS